MAALLTPAETAEMLNVAVETLHYWRGNRTGPRYVKVGRLVRYRLDDLTFYIEANVVEPAA